MGGFWVVPNGYGIMSVRRKVDVVRNKRVSEWGRKCRGKGVWEGGKCKGMGLW